MKKYKFILVISMILLISRMSYTQSEQKEQSTTREPVFTPNTYIDTTMLLPTPDLNSVLTEPNESSISEEAMFATYSFSEAGTTYNVELYYRELYHRLRARVLIGDRELKGLLNRFYDVDPGHRYMLSVYRGDDGNPELRFNFGRILLTESILNTDAIYDTIEAYVKKSSPKSCNPRIRVDRPPGLLNKTCIARVPGHYLVNEEGQVGPFTFENLLIAYCHDGVRAERLEDFERIGRSIVATYGVSPTIISDINEIRKYSPSLLESKIRNEIKPPQFYRDNESQTDNWICYAYERYKMGPLFLVCYKFGFQNGLLSSGERIVLGEDRTGAFTGYPSLGSLRTHEKVVLDKNKDGAFELKGSESNNVSLPDMSTLNNKSWEKDGQSNYFPLAVLRVTFVGVGVFLLVLAYVVHKYIRPSSRASRQNIVEEPLISERRNE